MSGLSFIRQYITKPRTVGAVLPSSKFLADKMTSNIDFNNAQCIVEYGAGTGVFTENILKLRKPDTVVILFENNQQFYNLLNEKYANEANLYVVNDSAEHIGKYLQMHNVSVADYIISGLPFASLPQAVSANIMTQTKNFLRPGGSFITFQYTLLKRDFIKQYFANIAVTREIRNVPPAYVFCCKG
ncbi:MAG: methyltransferase [Defluviitaleaceae bacterium]|nr:methyltransferase [Defluviitaleaceae bacterium]